MLKNLLVYFPLILLFGCGEIQQHVVQLDTIKSDIDDAQTEVADIATEINDVKSDIYDIKQDIKDDPLDDIQNDIDSINDSINSINERIQNIADNIAIYINEQVMTPPFDDSNNDQSVDPVSDPVTNPIENTGSETQQVPEQIEQSETQQVPEQIEQSETQQVPEQIEQSETQQVPEQIEQIESTLDETEKTFDVVCQNLFEGYSYFTSGETITLNDKRIFYKDSSRNNSNAIISILDNGGFVITYFDGTTCNEFNYQLGDLPIQQKNDGNNQTKYIFSAIFFGNLVYLEFVSISEGTYKIITADKPSQTEQSDNDASRSDNDNSNSDATNGNIIVRPNESFTYMQFSNGDTVKLVVDERNQPKIHVFFSLINETFELDFMSDTTGLTAQGASPDGSFYTIQIDNKSGKGWEITYMNPQPIKQEIVNRDENTNENNDVNQDNTMKRPIVSEKPDGTIESLGIGDSKTLTDRNSGGTAKISISENDTIIIEIGDKTVSNDQEGDILAEIIDPERISQWKYESGNNKIVIKKTPDGKYHVTEVVLEASKSNVDVPEGTIKSLSVGESYTYTSDSGSTAEFTINGEDDISVVLVPHKSLGFPSITASTSPGDGESRIEKPDSNTFEFELGEFVNIIIIKTSDGKYHITNVTLP